MTGDFLGVEFPIQTPSYQNWATTNIISVHQVLLHGVFLMLNH